MTTNPESQIPNPNSQVEELGEYCREIERYLCRKNEGRLIEIFGPRFDLVQGWFGRGIPLKIVMHGIDRCVERRKPKERSRRPVPIEFCEADVLDVFDEWRRAVGVSAAGAAGEVGEAGEAGRGSLPAHLERVIARLTALRAGSDRSLDPVLDDLVRELDAARAKSKSVRGEARDALIDRLQQLDGSLVEALRQRLDDRALQQLSDEAGEELKPFKVRMPADAYQQSHRACVDRLLRERAGLPSISYE